MTLRLDWGNPLNRSATSGNWDFSQVPVDIRKGARKRYRAQYGSPSDPTPRPGGSRDLSHIPAGDERRAARRGLRAQEARGRYGSPQGAGRSGPGVGGRVGHVARTPPPRVPDPFSPGDSMGYDPDPSGPGGLRIGQGNRGGRGMPVGAPGPPPIQDWAYFPPPPQQPIENQMGTWNPSNPIPMPISSMPVGAPGPPPQQPIENQMGRWISSGPLGPLPGGGWGPTGPPPPQQPIENQMGRWNPSNPIPMPMPPALMRGGMMPHQLMRALG